MGYGTTKSGKGWGPLPNRGTFTMGSSNGDKESANGRTTEGKDIRSLPGKNQGKMPGKT